MSLKPEVQLSLEYGENRFKGMLKELDETDSIQKEGLIFRKDLITLLRYRRKKPFHYDIYIEDNGWRCKLKDEVRERRERHKIMEALKTNI